MKKSLIEKYSDEQGIDEPKCDYLHSSYPGDQYDRPEDDDDSPDGYADNYPFDDEGEEVEHTVTIDDLHKLSSRLELLPGAAGNYTPANYPKHRISAIKALRTDYGFEFATLKYAFKNVNMVYSQHKYWGAAIKYQPQDNDPIQEQIDELRDLQRQMLDIIDNMRESRDEIERLGYGGAAARLDTYVIAHIECSVTSEHSWLDCSTSIDSIIEELEEE